MAMSLLMVAAAGLASLQKVSVVQNAYARELGVANAFAQRWIETLKIDGQRWRYFAGNPAGFANDGLGNTLWLNSVTVTPNIWTRALPNTQMNAWPAADAWGNSAPDAAPADHQFCASVRLNWLFPRTQSDMPSIRADVRVHWAKARSVGPLNNLTVCDPGLPYATLSSHASDAGSRTWERYNFVYLSTTILPTYFN